MEFLDYILFSLLFSFIVVIVVSTLVLWSSASPSECKKVYNELPTKTFYLNVDYVYDTNSKDYYKKYPENFVWFVKRNDFKIGNGKYIHNFVPTYLSPVHLYWLIKYQRWFKKNVDINKLERY